MAGVYFLKKFYLKIIFSVLHLLKGMVLLWWISEYITGLWGLNVMMEAIKLLALSFFSFSLSKSDLFKDLICLMLSLMSSGGYF